MLALLPMFQQSHEIRLNIAQHEVLRFYRIDRKTENCIDHSGTKLNFMTYHIFYSVTYCWYWRFHF